MKRASTSGVVRIALAWALLMALLALTAAVSRWHLGAGNLAASLSIAALKIAVIGWLFMGLRDASRLLRLAALLGVALLLVLAALSALDFAVRAPPSAPYRAAEQVAPQLWQDHARRAAPAR